MNTQLIGVIEGFYGNPWSNNQRKTLFKRISKIGMNSYLYAPKDDLKHRADWRLSYTDEECSILKELITESIKYNIEFIYAISPGLDITYSCLNDQNYLINKFKQLLSIGCKSFAILFDDIDDELKTVDKDCFKSFANAQCFVTNLLNDKFKELINYFMFCPTEYCTKFAFKAFKKTQIEEDFKLDLSEYLNSIGENLGKNIDILWTGPSVISKEISLEHINEVISVIKRKPLIWENYHANDYDRSRMFLGPLKLRSIEIKNYIRGILSNPNCEFELNFNAFYSLSKWFKSISCEEEVENDKQKIKLLIENEMKNYFDSRKDSIKNQNENIYDLRKILEESVLNWMPIFYESTPVLASNKALLNQENSSILNTESGLSELSIKLFNEAKTKAVNSFDSNLIIEKDKQVEEVYENRLDEIELKILCDFFYFPFNYGYYAHFVLNLVKDSINLFKSNNSNLNLIQENFYLFENFIISKFNSLCNKLEFIPNKQLKADLLNNRYLGELIHTLIVVENLIKILLNKKFKNDCEIFNDIVYQMRGGFSTELKRLIEIENINLTNLSEKAFTKNLLKINLVFDKSLISDLKLKFQINDLICLQIKEKLTDKIYGSLISDTFKVDFDQFKNSNLIHFNFDSIKFVEEFLTTIKSSLAILVAFYKLIGSNIILISVDNLQLIEYLNSFTFLDKLDHKIFKFKLELF